MTQVGIGGEGRVRVWDPIVRLFHWGAAAGFVAAFFIDRPLAWHELIGYAVAVLLVVRLVWGFLGSRHARFADFVPGPGALLRYLRALAGGQERRYLGHNPAGGIMVVALLAALAVTATTGWMLTTERWWLTDWVETLHVGTANAIWLLVGLHVIGVLWESVRHRENLVAAMITGFKRP